MQNKKVLSNKEIYRALAVQYKQPKTVSIALLSELASGVYYPLDLEGESRLRYKAAFLSTLKKFTSTSKDSLTEDEFCQAMTDFEQYSKEEVDEGFCQKMFNRYQNQQKVIDEKGFTLLAKTLQINESDIKDTFLCVCDRSNVITYEKLRDYLR